MNRYLKKLELETEVVSQSSLCLCWLTIDDSYKLTFFYWITFLFYQNNSQKYSIN